MIHRYKLFILLLISSTVLLALPTQAVSLTATAEIAPIFLTAQDTIPRDITPSSFEEAREALESGDYDSVSNYLSTVKDRKEKNSFRHKMLQAELLLATLDTNGADHIVSALSPKQITDPKWYEELRSRLTRASRMLQSALPTTIVGKPFPGTETKLRDLLSEWARPVGDVEEKAFTPGNGAVKWVVTPNDEGGETFGIVGRLGDGTWDEAHMERLTVLGLDHTGSLAYPFVLSDGVTIYFAYRGPETLGGWDIYLSRYNATDGTLLVPQQLPIPINSPADDIAYLYDESSETGVLLTLRDTPKGDALLVKLRKDPTGTFPTEDEAISKSLFFRSQNRINDEKLFGDEKVELRKSPNEPLFYIRDKAITSKDDLTDKEARKLLAEYTRLADRIESKVGRLESLRAEYGEKPTDGKGSLSMEIIALEKELRELPGELVRLRNQVIRTETGEKMTPERPKEKTEPITEEERKETVIDFSETL